jgi:hypothetical protein
MASWRSGGQVRKAELFSGPQGYSTLESRDSKVAGALYSLRDKVFSSLNTSKPTVRSITRFADGSDRAEEFVSRVVSRTNDVVFLVWTNDFNNKVWLAAVDLTRRKAVLAQVFEGITSLGGEVETLDCRRHAVQPTRFKRTCGSRRSPSGR